MANKVDVLAVMDSLQWGFNHRRCPMCAGWNMSENGETDMAHTKSCPVVEARAAVAELIEADQRAICRMERALEAAAELNKLLPEAQPIRDLLSTVVGQTSLAIEAKRAALARVKAD